jgi:pimeloyl-ACP methyl ester carboxylesterase
MISILLLHGALGSSSQLEPLKSALLQKGLDTHTLNFSGHSGTPFSPEFGIEQFADEVFQFLIEGKFERVNIFGYSMGGYVALWLAHRHPGLVKKIVTLGTKFDWSHESAEREIAKMNPEKIEAKIPAFARVLAQRHAPNDWKLLMQKTSDMMRQLGSSPLLSEQILKTISTETIVALGDLDDMADRAYSKNVTEILSNSRFVLLEQTPHPIEKVAIEKLVELIA